MQSRTALLCAGLLLACTPISAMSTLGRGEIPNAIIRRLVIAMDGTGGSEDLNSGECGHESRGVTLYNPNNIIKTIRAIRPVTSDGVSQILYYSEGVGSFSGGGAHFERFQGWVDKFVGGVFGGGFEGRIKSAYRFLVANYQAGDQILIFGFSRGGAEAQGLVRFIDYMGGLLHKEDVSYTVEFFDAFKNHVDVTSVFKNIRDGFRTAALSEKRPVDAQPTCVVVPIAEGPLLCGAVSSPPRFVIINDPRPVQIQFLGLYDPVLSVGSRLGSALGAGDSPPKSVRNVRVALAIDERRWDFRPQVWRAPASPDQSLLQLWFPGVHSDLGGGNCRDVYANTVLKWMLSEVGLLEVDCDYLKHYVGVRPSPSYQPRPNSDPRWSWLWELLRAKSGRGVRALDYGKEAGIGLHESVSELLIRDPTYRPVNLLRYLAQDESHIAQLPKAQQPCVGRIVQEFRAKTKGEPTRSSGANHE